MKNLFVTLSLLFAVAMLSCAKDNDYVIDFTAYGHYFVKNTFRADSAGSFFEIHDTASFNRVYGAAATMEKITWITPDDFSNKFVIAIVKDFGANLYELKITKISLDKSILRVDYNYSLINKNLSYSSVGNAIVMLKNQSYSMIHFYENGRFVKQISMQD